MILEITAANRANICSYTVSYKPLSQPVHVVVMIEVIFNFILLSRDLLYQFLIQMIKQRMYLFVLRVHNRCVENIVLLKWNPIKSLHVPLEKVIWFLFYNLIISFFVFNMFRI